jgi:hypothetical protein
VSRRLFHDLHIPMPKVRLVSGNLGDVEVLGGPLDERHEEIRVVDGPAANVHSGNNLRLDSAHQVALEPLAGLSITLVLVVGAIGHRTKRLVENPEASTAKSVSTDVKGKLLTETNSLRIAVRAGFAR